MDFAMQILKRCKAKEIDLRGKIKKELNPASTFLASSVASQSLQGSIFMAAAEIQQLTH